MPVSATTESRTKEKRPVSPSRTGTYPCPAMGNNDIGYDMCTATTTMPQRNRMYCCTKQCKSTWRRCLVCVEQGATDESWTEDPITGLCHFHRANGVNAKRNVTTAVYKPPVMRVQPRWSIADVSPKEFEGRRTIPATVPAKWQAGVASPPTIMEKSFVKKPVHVERTPVSRMIPTHEFTPEQIDEVASKIPLIKGRRLEVLNKLAKGLTNVEIAEALNTTNVTVNVTVSTLFKLLGLPETPGNKLESGRSKRKLVMDAYERYAAQPLPAAPLSLPVYEFDFKSIDRAIGVRIALHRKARGMTLSALAKSVGVSADNVSQYEKGSKKAYASTLYAIAKVLEVPITDFLKDE